MRRICLLIPLLILVVSGFPQKSVSAQAGSPGELIDLVNEVRVSYGQAPFSVNSALMSSAQAHADYMAATGIVSHTGIGGSDPTSRAYAAGYGNGMTVYVSENISGGMNQSLEDIVNGVWSDDAHMRTMVDPEFLEIGAGTSFGANGWAYYVIETGFVSTVPAPPSALAAAWTPTPGTPQAGIKPSSTPNVAPVKKAKPEEDGSVVHVVEKGQAVWSIAMAYGVSEQDIINLNNLPAEPVIQIGQKLIVKPPYTPTPTPTASNTPFPPTPTPTRTFAPITPGPTLTLTPSITPTFVPLFVGVDALKGIDRRGMGIGLVIFCALGLGGIIFYFIRTRRHEKPEDIDPVEALLSEKQDLDR